MARNCDELDFYELLDIPATADDRQITEAIKHQRRKLVQRQNHSDLEVRHEAERCMAAVARAEEVLLDPRARATYDAQRRPSRESPGAADATHRATDARADSNRANRTSDQQQKRRERQREERERAAQERRVDRQAHVATAGGMLAWLAVYAPLSWVTSLAAGSMASGSNFDYGSLTSFEGLYLLAALFSVLAAPAMYQISRSQRNRDRLSGYVRFSESIKRVGGVVALSPIMGFLLMIAIALPTELVFGTAVFQPAQYAWSAPACAAAVLWWTARQEAKASRAREAAGDQ